MIVQFTGGDIDPMIINMDVDVVPHENELVFMGDGVRRYVRNVSHYYDTKRQDVNTLIWSLYSVGRKPVVCVDLEKGLPPK